MKALFQKSKEIKLDGYDFKLMANDNLALAEFGNMVSMYGGIVNYYTMLLKEMDSQADSLITTLTEEYQLE